MSGRDNPGECICVTRCDTRRLECLQSRGVQFPPDTQVLPSAAAFVAKRGVHGLQVEVLEPCREGRESESGVSGKRVDTSEQVATPRTVRRVRVPLAVSTFVYMSGCTYQGGPPSRGSGSTGKMSVMSFPPGFMWRDHALAQSSRMDGCSAQKKLSQGKSERISWTQVLKRGALNPYMGLLAFTLSSCPLRPATCFHLWPYPTVRTHAEAHLRANATKRTCNRSRGRRCQHRA